MNIHIALVVDDEPKIRAIVQSALEHEAERILEAASGSDAIAVAERERPDFIILDLGLPDMEGVDVCRSIRAWSSAPILVLSARASEEEKAALLDAGADDYVTKPFSTLEFQARVRAQARRARITAIPGSDAPLAIHDVIIDTARREITRLGEAVRLTPTEWALLRVLVANAGRTVTHAKLFRAVWGESYGDAQLYLRVYVAHLRRKLEADSYQPRLIVTEPGVGYRFVLDP